MPVNAKSLENLKPFQPGQVTNPAGRPRGARSRLSELTIQRLLDDFEVHGVEAIEQVRQKSPQTYLQCVVSLLPKQQEKITPPLHDLSDEELEQLEHWLASSKAKQLDLMPADVVAKDTDT